MFPKIRNSNFRSASFSSDLIPLPTFSSSGVHSASDTNEYQGIFLAVNCGRRLTALPNVNVRTQVQYSTPSLSFRDFLREGVPFHFTSFFHNVCARRNRLLELKRNKKFERKDVCEINITVLAVYLSFLKVTEMSFYVTSSCHFENYFLLRRVNKFKICHKAVRIIYISFPSHFEISCLLHTTLT